MEDSRLADRGEASRSSNLSKNSNPKRYECKRIFDEGMIEMLSSFNTSFGT